MFLLEWVVLRLFQEYLLPLRHLTQVILAVVTNQSCLILVDHLFHFLFSHLLRFIFKQAFYLEEALKKEIFFQVILHAPFQILARDLE